MLCIWSSRTLRLNSASFVTPSWVALSSNTASPSASPCTDTSLELADPEIAATLEGLTDHSKLAVEENSSGTVFARYFSVSPLTILPLPSISTWLSCSLILLPYTSHSLIPTPLVPVAFLPTRIRSAVVVTVSSKFTTFQMPFSPLNPPCSVPASAISFHSSPSRYSTFALEGQITPPPSDHHITRIEAICWGESHVRLIGIG